MKKIVRLQESDIANLVKKILSEQENEPTVCSVHRMLRIA